MATKQKVSKQSGETPEKVILSIDGATKTGYFKHRRSNKNRLCNLAKWRNSEKRYKAIKP